MNGSHKQILYLIAWAFPVSVHTRSGRPPESGAIWILHPDSDCNLLICSPPRPITRIETVTVAKSYILRQGNNNK